MPAATAAHACLGLAGLAAQEGANRQRIASTATNDVKDPRDTAKVIICDQRVRATGAAGAGTAALVGQSVTLATTVALGFFEKDFAYLAVRTKSGTLRVHNSLRFYFRTKKTSRHTNSFVPTPTSRCFFCDWRRWRGTADDLSLPVHSL